MFAGHIGAALAIGRAEREVNVGVFIAAALLLDLLLWLFVLLGLESVIIPADFVDTHQPRFVFPYSHGLLASVVWSAVAGVLGLAFYSHLKQRWWAATLIAVAVLSHWLLDALVHQPELPLAGSSSHAVGMGLWRHMPVALTLEAAIVAVGLCLFVPGSRIARGKSLTLIALNLVVMAFTAVGMTVSPAPPSAVAMAGSSLATLMGICLLSWWLGRGPSSPNHRSLRPRRQ
jgi:hypothetical protein